MNTDEIFKIKEAAAFARVAVPTLRKAIKSGALRAALIPGGGGYRILKSDLIGWVKDGCKGISDES